MPEMLQTPAMSTTAETPRPASRQQSQQEVQRLLEKASYFTIFTVPDQQSLSVGTPLIPFIPQSVYMIEITEAPRRLQVNVSPPSPEYGFRTSKTIGTQQVAHQHLWMRPSPNNFQSGPNRMPPPTVLLPFLSQRFWMYNGQFDFLDGPGGTPYSGFKAIAGGRFFPAGQQSVWIGGIADIVTGQGQLQGFTGNLAINGLTTPPQDFMNSFLFRFVDLEGKLQAAAMPAIPDPAPPTTDTSDSALIPLQADLAPGSTIDIEPLPNSSAKRIHLVERLRLVSTNFNVAPGVLKTKDVVGEVVGLRRTTLIFSDDTLNPVPAFSENSEFTFFAGGDKPIGTLKVDLFEARAFPTSLPGLAKPFYRLVGFGPYTSGTGQFVSPLDGMLSVNGALSLDPPAWSAMYLLRFRDPLLRFQSQWGNGV